MLALKKRFSQGSNWILDQPSVLVTASTGKATTGINGITLRSEISLLIQDWNPSSIKSQVMKLFTCWETNINTENFYCRFLSCHVRISERIQLCSCLNVKELLNRSRHEIWSLSDCNWTRNHNHLVQISLVK